MVVTQPVPDPSRRARGLAFGSVAQQYERFRLGYPPELVDAVIGYAGKTVGCALEIGAGTGKATRLFAAQGIEVTALEPDPQMAALLQRSTRGISVHPVAALFEQFTTARRFDLLYAAASWHWTDPVGRWSRAVNLLVPGGVLALFGRPSEIKDPALLAAVEEIEKEVKSGDDQADVHLWSIDDVVAADGLFDVVQLNLPSVLTTTAEDFLARLATTSTYLILKPQARADALRRVRAALPKQFEIDATVQLTMARRG